MINEELVNEELVSGINIALICVIGLLATMQNKERRLIATVYALALLTHTLIAETMLHDGGRLWAFHHDTIFFISAALFDLMVITYIAKFYRVPELGADLQFISLVSVIYNAFGWVLVNVALELPVYNMLYTILYGYAIFVLIRREPENARHYRNDSRFFAFHSNYI